MCTEGVGGTKSQIYMSVQSYKNSQDTPKEQGGEFVLPDTKN